MTTYAMMGDLSLREVVGGGYYDFWNFKGRYRVVKGSRASKKSKTAALNFIVRMMEYPDANLLVVRKVFRTLKDSCYTELKWAIHRLRVDAWWDCKESPLEMTYRKTGQKIYFRGLDDPQKVTSITVQNGCLCWMWIEESYELNAESDFDMLDESIRGEVPDGLYKQVTLTFNPWNEHHWLKKRFFDTPNDETLAITTNYKMNEWLDESDYRVFETMQQINPRRYRVAGLGEWGIVEGLIFSNWREWDSKFIINDRGIEVGEGHGDPTVDDLMQNQNYRGLYGIDFGYNDPTAFVACRQKRGEYVIYIYDEFYQSTMNNAVIANTLRDKGYHTCKIMADSEDPRTINELKMLGLNGIRPAKKGSGSVLGGIQKLQDYQLIVHPRCQNTIAALSNYAWQTDKLTGQIINTPQHDFSHIPDALRYATEELSKFGIQFA